MCTPQREHVCLCAPARAVLRRPELLCRHQFPTDETSPYGRGGGGSQRQPSPLQGFPAGLSDREIRPPATPLPVDTTVPRPVLPPAQLALCRRRPPRGGLLSHKDPRESALHEEEPFSLVKTGDFTRLREAKPKAGTEVRPPTGKHTGAARVQGERVQAHPIRVSPREATEPEPLHEGAAGGHAEGGRRLNCAVTKLQTAPRGPPAPPKRAGVWNDSSWSTGCCHFQNRYCHFSGHLPQRICLARGAAAPPSQCSHVRRPFAPPARRGDTLVAFGWVLRSKGLGPLALLGGFRAVPVSPHPHPQARAQLPSSFLSVMDTVTRES